ncbi:MAG: hypothetical protein MZV63_49720 [Marinilabiliales bacterium]|nr:hypothetical protein [Marinilabiliales bacterium]
MIKEVEERQMALEMRLPNASKFYFYEASPHRDESSDPAMPIVMPSWPGKWRLKRRMKPEKQS